MNEPRKRFGGQEVGAVIVAAGSGRRMRGTGDKLFLDLGGIPLLGLTLRNVVGAGIDNVVLVAGARIIDDVRTKILPLVECPAPVILVEGGARRQDSVLCGLQGFALPPRTVIVHDGDRPFASSSLMAELARSAASRGMIAAIPSRDTIKLVEGKTVVETLERRKVWRAQTPQAFPYAELLAGHLRARTEGWEVTDDASIMERSGFPVEVMEGSEENIKVTTPEDRGRARAIYRRLYE